VLGAEVGGFVRRVHEAKGVAFRLGRKPVRITDGEVVLDDDTALRAAVVVMGVGGRVRAVVTIGRDRLGLEIEAAMEREDDAALEALVRG